VEELEQNRGRDVVREVADDADRPGLVAKNVREIQVEEITLDDSDI
jgi:hypothetical protein